jgi:hypothetical protein
MHVLKTCLYTLLLGEDAHKEAANLAAGEEDEDILF